MLQVKINLQESVTNDNNLQEQSNAFPFYSAVEIFQYKEIRKTLLFLYKFSKISLNDSYTYTTEFDESCFSGCLINFIDVSKFINLEILKITLDILTNLTHYSNEYQFLNSLIQRGLYDKMNSLLQTPIAFDVSCKIFHLLGNIAISSEKNRNDVLSLIDFTFFFNSLNSMIILKDAFMFICKTFTFPFNEETLTNMFDLVFSTIYHIYKVNNFAYFNSFLSFLYIAVDYFDRKSFENYLLDNEIFTDLFTYFSNSSSLKPKTILKILSILSSFIPYKPQIFTPLVPLILSYIESWSALSYSSFHSEIATGYSILMNLLFVRFGEIFSIEDLQNITISLLKYEKKLSYKLKIQIGLIVSHHINYFSQDFIHQNLGLFYDACNDWITDDCLDLLIGAVFIVIKVQMIEDSYDNSSSFLVNFVEENYNTLIQFLEEKISDDLYQFTLVIINLYNDLQN